MPLPLLTLTPSQAGYSMTPGTPGTDVALDGGLGRYRRDQLYITFLAEVSWTLSPAQYEALRAFYKVTTAHGSSAFEMDLIVDDAELTRHQVSFVTGSFALTGVEGNRHKVSASLEVWPLPVDVDYTTTILDLIEAYGSAEEADDVLNQLAYLVNVQLPEYLV